MNNLLPPLKPNNIWKTILYAVGIPICIAILVFTSFFVYYLWQIKFGSPENAQKLADSFSGKFTVINSQSNKPEPSPVKDLNKFIRLENPQKGEKNATVTIVGFIDFECPYCIEDYLKIKNITQKYEPILKIVIKHLPMTNLHPESFNAALASMCANEQKKFWEYYDELFIAKKIDSSILKNSARKIGLNMEQFDSCYTTEKYKKEIEKDMMEAVEIGVRGTPTYLINNKIIEGVANDEIWEKEILSSIKK